MKLKCIFDNKEIIILIKDGDEVINIGNLNDNNILTVNYVIQPDKSSYQLSYIFEKCNPLVINLFKIIYYHGKLFYIIKHTISIQYP